MSQNNFLLPITVFLILIAILSCDNSNKKIILADAESERAEIIEKFKQLVSRIDHAISNFQGRSYIDQESYDRDPEEAIALLQERKEDIEISIINIRKSGLENWTVVEQESEEVLYRISSELKTITVGLDTMIRIFVEE